MTIMEASSEEKLSCVLITKNESSEVSKGISECILETIHSNRAFDQGWQDVSVPLCVYSVQYNSIVYESAMACVSIITCVVMDVLTPGILGILPFLFEPVREP